MKYTVYTTPAFDRAFKKLDRYTQKLLAGWIRNHLKGCEDPRSRGKELTHCLWHYRIGDDRLICEINDDELIILALSAGIRKAVLWNDMIPPK